MVMTPSVEALASLMMMLPPVTMAVRLLAPCTLLRLTVLPMRLAVIAPSVTVSPGVAMLWLNTKALLVLL